MNVVWRVLDLVLHGSRAEHAGGGSLLPLVVVGVAGWFGCLVLSVFYGGIVFLIACGIAAVLGGLWALARVNRSTARRRDAQRVQNAWQARLAPFYTELHEACGRCRTRGRPRGSGPASAWARCRTR